MKHRWKRRQPTVDLTPEDVTRILASTGLTCNVTELAQTATGLVNTVYRVDIDAPPHRLCLKIGQRGETSAAVEFRATALRQGRDTPQAMSFLPHEPISGHPCMVFSWVEGIRIDMHAEHLGEDERTRLSFLLGAQLAQIHGSARFGQTGLLALERDRLTVREPFSLSLAGLHDYATATLRDEVRARVGAARSEALIQWTGQHRGGIPASPAVLCHGDYGTENVLIDRSEQLWVLDWEFACSGHPLLDLGHLLRTPLLAEVPFHDAVAAGYRSEGGILTDDWPRWARVLDLFAWVGFAGRPHIGPDTLAEVRHRIDRVLTTESP